MTDTKRPARENPVMRWVANQPYLLLSLTMLFWGTNIVLGRYVADHVPPFALSFVRWFGAFLVVLPFAWKHLARDWPAIRAKLWIMVILSITGIAAYNSMAYYALRYTEALNALLIQSSGPLFVALWSLVLFGIRLTLAQAIGIAISLAGVAVILTRGELAKLASVDLHFGDLLFAAALLVFSFYSAVVPRRPPIHALSFLAFTTGCGSLFIVPLWIIEAASGWTPVLDTETVLTFIFAMIFPSTLAYLCYNRGVELIGANRAAPFGHLMPVFGSVLAIAFLGERPQLFHAIGYALVIAGIFVAARRSSAAGPTPA